MHPLTHVPEDGHDGIGAGSAKCFSTGSAAVLLGTQPSHDLLFDITGGRATTTAIAG